MDSAAAASRTRVGTLLGGAADSPDEATAAFRCGIARRSRISRRARDGLVPEWRVDRVSRERAMPQGCYPRFISDRGDRRNRLLALREWLPGQRERPPV